ncbi:Plasmodium exported protein (PHISTa), unknown function [Plasmodium sp. gorilla clade G2]|uniref:Plasmodium exported protein (PHISTa), unknown function n=1 Tax=Plasmodium sp. gorilla clade G2 TaxID=880535 RepID=UPI000D2174C7|nr:Plasmodium exported protein (PHISTa), unknown function [Plasmodium sp. gorilla clade G2]SOV11119.1 Plasmodium exported protein (PHISTa), unknown function [Plasmodium sp. gorilla clade G2]
MKCNCVQYYSEENHMKNTMNACSSKRKILKLLSITGILLLVVVLNSIVICEKSETKNAGIYDIYRRNLSELESVNNKRLRSSSHKNKLRSTLDEKNNNIPLSSQYNNINYNDLSKQLTLEDLHNVLDNLKERPSNEDLHNIWNQVLGVAKYGFDDMLKDLSYYIEEYLLTYEYQTYHHMSDRVVSVNTEYRTWYKSMHDIAVALSSTDVENTLKFFSLIKDGASLDEMINFIYLFLKYYETLKIDLYNEHKKIFTERMMNPQRLDI